MITYQLQEGSNVELNIYDLSGRKVAVLVSEKQQTGMQEVEWNVNGMQPGVYFCELKTARCRKVMKIIKL